MRKTHGLSHTPAYKRWDNMKRRCGDPTHPAYIDYGGRGITVCDRWKESFAAFLADMGECPPNHSLDRADNDGNYEPGNCRWATAKTQANNRRGACGGTQDRAYVTLLDPDTGESKSVTIYGMTADALFGVLFAA